MSATVTTQTSTKQPLAIMGGAFDPVHVGHLRTAIEIGELLEPGELVFIPSGNPPHRAPHIAPAAVRVQMLSVAIAALPACRIDERELRRNSPSYTVATLEEIRAENPARSLCMIVGMDAFLGLAGWHRWRELFDLAHIVVAARPGSALEPGAELAAELDQRQTTSPAELRGSPAGRILVHGVTQLEVSSSAIRDRLGRGLDVTYLLPDGVKQVIATTGCYAPPTAKEQQLHA